MGGATFWAVLIYIARHQQSTQQSHQQQPRQEHNSKCHLLVKTFSRPYCFWTKNTKHSFWGRFLKRLRLVSSRRELRSVPCVRSTIHQSTSKEHVRHVMHRKNISSGVEPRELLSFFWISWKRLRKITLNSCQQLSRKWNDKVLISRQQAGRSQKRFRICG